MTPLPGNRDLLAPLRAAPARSAVLCDIDGTLAPISPTPEGAAVPERTRRALGVLAEAYELVACVSGRRAIEARSLVGVEELVYVGNHGFELLDPGDPEPRIPPEISRQAQLASEFVDSLDRTHLDSLGLRLEDKGPIQSLHWRGSAREPQAEREAKALAAWASERGLEARWGRKVLELRPPAEIDKGSTIARLLTARGSRRALYGGDDVTDLDAFRALRTMRSEGALEHAVCVGVASDEEPDELRALSDIVVTGTSGFVELLVELSPER